MSDNNQYTYTTSKHNTTISSTFNHHVKIESRKIYTDIINNKKELDMYTHDVGIAVNIVMYKSPPTR
jgi:hypothetical protein